MSAEMNKSQNDTDISLDGFILPCYGLAIASEKPSLQLCKPKLLPLKSYSFVRMQQQNMNRIEQTSSDNHKTMDDD